MTYKEFTIQNALGTLNEYNVEIKVPVSATASLWVNVSAGSPEDAIKEANAKLKKSLEKKKTLKSENGFYDCNELEVSLDESIEGIVNCSFRVEEGTRRISMVTKRVGDDIIEG